MKHHSKDNLKIILVGAGTAGHITPLLAIAHELRHKQSGISIGYIGQRGDKNLPIIKDGAIDSIKVVFAGKYRRYYNEPFMQRLFDVKTHLLNARDVIKIFLGTVESFAYLLRNRPDLVFLKGGFIVVPVGWACTALKIRYITHDSDTIPGLANRLIARHAYMHAVVYDDIDIYSKEKMVVTGIPLVKEYVERRGVHKESYKAKLEIPLDSKVLFVYVGTQGARSIDRMLEVIVPKLLDSHPELYVVHVFGRLNEASCKTQYSSYQDQSRIRKLTFIDNAFDYIAAADIIIARAGATTLAEFAAIGRACVIVPAEQLTSGHQIKNAEYYRSRAAARVVQEGNIEELLAVVSELLDDDSDRHKLEQSMLSLGVTDAAERIADLCLKSAGTGVK